MKRDNTQPEARDSPNILHFKGKVFAGKGEGAKYLELPWVRRQIVEGLGFIPFIGTLNIRLFAEGVGLRGRLEKVRAAEIVPLNGFCLGKCYRAYLKDKSICAIVVPGVTGHPADVLEIIAPTCLRERLHLGDGDLIEVMVSF
jgi:riboflavin kinase